MGKVKRSWMAMVMGALLLGALVGVVWARPHDRPETQDITRKVTLTGADFIPSDESADWSNSGDYAYCNIGSCIYTAPVVFPCLPSVTVERIKLHVCDTNGGAAATASLRRTYPPTGADVLLGSATSTGCTPDPETITSSPINQVVWPSQRAYIWLDIGDKYIKVHGVTVEYHRNI